MLRDASGNERKGIEVWCDFLGRVTEVDADSCVGAIRDCGYAEMKLRDIPPVAIHVFEFWKTVRDLMLAGF